MTIQEIIMNITADLFLERCLLVMIVIIVSKTIIGALKYWKKGDFNAKQLLLKTSEDLTSTIIGCAIFIIAYILNNIHVLGLAQYFMAVIIGIELFKAIKFANKKLEKEEK